MGDPGHCAPAPAPNFFAAEHYPRIRFDSDPFPLSELATGGVVHGMLALHGQRHPVALALPPSDCPHQPVSCVIRARSTITRSTFGMRAWRGLLSIRVELELRILLSDRP